MARFARENKSCRAVVQRSTIFAEGAFMKVFKGEYTEGARAGEPCVSKEFKTGCVYEKSYFQNELKVVDKALEIITQFNDDDIINKCIYLNIPTIWTYEEMQGLSLVEPMILNFEKFNSNTGWTPDQSSPWIEVMQALSHYSFHITNRKLLICDLQGGIYQNGFVITDPVVISTTQQYGPTDLGQPGIATFFSGHRCNKYCNRNWMLPCDRKPHFKVQRGSAMVLPTRHTRKPLTAKGGRPLHQMINGLGIIEE